MIPVSKKKNCTTLRVSYPPPCRGFPFENRSDPSLRIYKEILIGPPKRKIHPRCWINLGNLYEEERGQYPHKKVSKWVLKMNRILLSSFWIDRFRLILHLEREVVNSKRGLEQERLKTFRYPFFQNLFKILPSSSFIVEARNDFQLFQIHFRPPPPYFLIRS